MLFFLIRFNDLYQKPLSMKTFLGVVLMFSGVSFSQVQSGIINDTAEMNIEHKKEFIEGIKKEDSPMRIKKQVIDFYENAEPDYYELHFTDNEAYYFKDEYLEREETYNIGSKAGLYPYCTNLSRQQFIGENRNFGYVAHEPLDWKTTSETKMIGDVKCYKATTTETPYSRQSHFYDRDIVTCYAPEIPVKYSPEYHSGLLGLVLEVQRKEFMITATKINLNPDEKKLKIMRVDKGEKVISQKEVNKRIEERLREKVIMYRNLKNKDHD
jgi:GLPGLI family protein